MRISDWSSDVCSSDLIVEPSEAHYYQPGWTMVGAGIFNREFTRRAEARLIPEGANWIKASASGFAPDENKVLLCDGRNLSYRVLIACPGIKLDCDAIPGLRDTLGRNIGRESCRERVGQYV